MTTAAYLQRGEALDYTNATEETIPHGAVVTGCPIPPGKTGTLHMVGVYEVKKTGTAAVEQGAAVYLDGDGITDTEGDVVAGYAAAPAAANDATILVKLCG